MTLNITRKIALPSIFLLLLAFSLLVFIPRLPVHQSHATPLSLFSGPQPLTSYGELPLVFEANQGQTAPKVSFLSHGPDFTLFLASGEAVLALRAPSHAANLRAHVSPSTSEPEATIALRMRLVGANPAAVLRGHRRTLGKVNYLIGSDPQKWYTNIPTYADVDYENVYPGINLIYKGDHRNLQYDFTVNPGAEPERIALEFQGIESVNLEPDGDLSIHIGGTIIRQARPIVYQQIEGVRREIAANYVLKNGGRVAFHLGAYDRSQSLVIDPTLAYSTYLGASSRGRAALGIAVDSAGNTYVSGFTESTAFPTTFGSVQTSYGGSGDAFVSKLNAAGSALMYSTYLGGSGTDYGFGIAVDETGNAYVIGQTDSTNFPVTPGAFQTSSRGGVDAFVSKLNPEGSALVYSTYLGGTDPDFGAGIAVDTVGNAYVTGATHSTDFPVTAGSVQTTYGGGLWDVFVSKLNADGSALVYSTYLGGNGGTQAAFGDVGWAITVDASGNAYVTGDGTPNFPTTPGVFQSACRSSLLNAFVSKLNPAGSALVYSTYVGGSTSWDWGDAIKVDAEGNAFVGGNANSSDFPTTSQAFQSSYGGGEDGVLFKLNAAGSALQYSTYLGGSDYEVVQGLAVDTGGNAYVTGVTYSSNFPTTSDALQTTYAGSGDAFITELNSQGSALVYSSYLGGSAFDWGFGIALDVGGNIYVSGLTSSGNFSTTPGAFQTTISGAQATFVTKFAFQPIDKTPPRIVVSVAPKFLWPPNGKMTPVTVSGTITDTESGVNLTSAAYAVQDEYGQVQPHGPITLGPGGTYSFTVLLQASRLGTDWNGRSYTIIVGAKDNAGNSGFKTSMVTVPHDQGN